MGRLTELWQRWLDAWDPIERRKRALALPPPVVAEVSVPVKPVPESTRHRFDATVYYAKAKGTRNEVERLYYAQRGMEACRRARDAYRRESGHLSAAMSCDLAALAMLAGEPGAAYAAASEGIAQPRISQKRRQELADIMAAAIAAGRLPLPMVTAA